MHTWTSLLRRAWATGSGPLISASPLHQFGLSDPDRGMSFAERFGDWRPASSDGQATAPRGLPGMIEEHLRQQGVLGAGLPSTRRPRRRPPPICPMRKPARSPVASVTGHRFGDCRLGGTEHLTPPLQKRQRRSAYKLCTPFVVRPYCSPSRSRRQTAPSTLE
jgi:hypothetical protein